MRIRKPFLILLIFVMLCAVMYTSLAYFIGLQAEKKIIALIKSYSSRQTQIVLKDYKRNIFNSTAKLEVQYEDYSQFNVDLEILHSPILQYTDNRGGYKFYFGKLLVKMKVFQIFLQDKKEIFSNISIVDLKKSPMTIDVSVGELTQNLYQKLGIYSSDKYKNVAHIQLNESNIAFNLTSAIDNQFTGNRLYKIKNSNLNISAQFFTNSTKFKVNPFEWQSKIKIVVTADKVANNEKNKLVILNLDKPSLDIDYSGGIASFMDVINTILTPITSVNSNVNMQESNKLLVSEKLYTYQNVIAKLLQIIFTDDNPSLLKVHYKNNKGELYNLDESFKFNNLDQDLTLGSTEKNFFLVDKSLVKNLIFKNKIKSTEFDNFSFLIDFSTDKELDRNFSTFEQFDFSQFLQSLLAQTNLDNFAKYHIETNFNLDKLKYKTLTEGYLNAEQINFNFSIKNSTSKNDKANDINPASFLNFNANVNNLMLDYSDNEMLNANIKNISITNSMNLTEYLNFFDQESQDGYNINFSTKADIPYVKYEDEDWNIDLSQILLNAKFKLDSKIKGYFNSNFEINKITTKTDIGELNLDKVLLHSDLKQAYKNIMTGENDITLTKFAWISNDKKTKLQGNNLKIINNADQDQKNKDFLSYGNKIYLDNLNYGQLSLGALNYEDKYTNISADKYIKFTTRSAADYINSNTATDVSTKVQQINNDQDDVFEQADLNQFLSIGMDIKNNLFLGRKDSNITVTNVINIPSEKATTSQSNTEFLNKLRLNSTVSISKDYIEQFLKATRNSDLFKQYDIWQKIGLLDFNQSSNSTKDKANVIITYDNKKLNINSKPMDYWLERIKNTGSKKKEKTTK